MDPVTTGIGGALIAKALPEERRGPIGVWVMTGAALFPDIDVFASSLTGGAFANWTVHRGYTHSFIGVITLAPLLALIAWAVRKDKNYKRLLSLCALALVWHIFTDVPTTWGTIVFWPFSWQPIAWDWVYIIDINYTGLLLLPQLAAWVYHRRQGALGRGGLAWLGVALALAVGLSALAIVLRRDFRWWGSPSWWQLWIFYALAAATLLLLPAWRGRGFLRARGNFCRAGLAALLLYVGLLGVLHGLALGKIVTLAQQDNLRLVCSFAEPQALSPFDWRGRVQTPRGVYTSWFSLLDDSAVALDLYSKGRMRRCRQATSGNLIISN